MARLTPILSSPTTRALLVWVAIAVSTAFVASDSWRRYRRIVAVTESKMSTPFPDVDPASVTGYESGMRKWILPTIGIDGCQWIMHTQQLLSDGAWRIRFTDIDNAPDGREVHWSHALIWWLVVLGKLHASITGLPLPASVEAVAPYANTILLFFLIAILPWFVYRRFGLMASIGLAIALASVYPFYEYFLVGNADHHGIAAAGGMACVLMIAVGGAGWVSRVVESPSEGEPVLIQPSFERALDAMTARRYFVGSALVGSISLWVSAATALPTLLGIGIGALVSIFVYGRYEPLNETRYQPALWRWWGMVGCLGSLFFYLLEYFPAHLGMRLEVNHPVYAIAWLGGGEILFRLARWWVEGVRPWRDRLAIPCIIGSLLGLLVPPMLVSLFPDRYFWVTDAFLWRLHQDHIFEFETFIDFARNNSRFAIWLAVGIVPVLSLFVLRLLGVKELGRSWKGTLTFVCLPGLLLTVLGLYQIRWLGIANALWLAVIPTILGCLYGGALRHRFTWWERLAAGIGAACVFLGFPQLSIRETIQRIGRPDVFTPEDVFEIYVRDLSYAIQRANPGQELTILTSPTITTSMMYYGGLNGIGTFYWENLAGLKAAARVYAAPTESAAFELVQLHRVTHLVHFASDTFGYEYVRLLRGLPMGTKVQDAFIPSMIARRETPIWLRPLYFQPPDQLASEGVLLLQVAVDQTPAQAHFSAALYHESRGDDLKAIEEFRLALKWEPQFREAWYRMGSRLMLIEGGDDATVAFEKGLVDRSAAEVTDLCGQTALKCFQLSRHAEAEFLLRRALKATPGQPTAINALAWLLATSVDDAVRRPTEALILAQANLALPDQITYLDTLAAAQAANGDFSAAVATMKQLIHLFTATDSGQENRLPDLFSEHLRSYEAAQPLRIGSPRG